MAKDATTKKDVVRKEDNNKGKITAWEADTVVREEDIVRRHKPTVELDNAAKERDFKTIHANI